MIVKVQYTDLSFWEGPPERFAESPDPRPPDGGVIWMWGITDDGRVTSFAYDDKYYLYRSEDGLWVLGSGTPKRDFAFLPDRTLPIELPIEHYPADAVVRYGCTIPDELAEAAGLRFSFNTALTGPDTPETLETARGCCG